MHKVPILLLLGLGACGGDQDRVYVWGEAAETLSSDWCLARDRCLSLDEYDRCWHHNMHHLCELDLTCDTPIPDAESVAALCAAELEEIDTPENASCIQVIFGVPPPSCNKLLTMMPGPK